MKNIRHIKILTILAVIVIFTLQGVWILNSYTLTQNQLQKQINELFEISVNKELILRIAIIQERNIASPNTEVTIGRIDNNSSTGSLISSELLFHEHLYQMSAFISLINLDSIFQSEIQQQNINSEFIINRIDMETGNILETTDPKEMGELQGAMESEIIPIRIDQSEGVQVLLISPYRAIFQQMAFILFLSILLIAFAAYSMFYQMSSLIKEKHLRQLQIDFSHALTHDMATPLQTISQVNNLLANEKLYNDPEKRVRYIQIAQQQILNLQALTDRILTVARSERSGLDINPALANLKDDIILPLVDKFKIQAKKPVEFNVSFLPDSIILHADTTLLTNAVSNLIDNAIKYSGASVKITIHCEKKNGNAFIYIKDNGYGISEKDQNKIFTKFERGKAVDRKEAKGFGLGLSYVKSVMEAHGGTINLFSKEGSGSEFVLFLPLGTENKIN